MTHTEAVMLVHGLCERLVKRGLDADEHVEQEARMAKVVLDHLDALARPKPTIQVVDAVRDLEQDLERLKQVIRFGH